MAKKSNNNSIRVGVLVSAALLILMVFLFFIGSEQKIFARKNEYEVRLENVTGLAEGNPVKMSGVTIGVIRDIKLPMDPKMKQVEILLMVDRKFAERVRGDSRVRLKKLGLLTGDSYIDVTPGTPRFAALEPGSMIPASRQADVEALLSSGEDLVDNFVQISYSLKNILQRIDRGEGLLGELTTAPETKQRLTDTLLTTLNKTNAALTHVESGKGVVGKLVYDDAYGEQLTTSLASAAQSLQTVTGSLQKGFETNEGLVPALVNDPAAKARVYEVVENLRLTSANLATFTSTMQKGEGLVPRLLNDKEYGDQALNEFTMLIRQLNVTVAKINNGEGTAGKVISDPAIYESINDILIGINESKLLRWLVRNRQQAGIERRVEEIQKAPVVEPAPPEVEPPPPPSTDTTGT
ncbi:MAG TPA: MlaD family protein [Thermoanaerobaculia bacterium]|jgi:phospholipid/cholesterol/gamma-HCH transport system substrate-binding protein|nr:MlaD family protein [Thermoanaerobaculia bacterium]